MTKPTRMATRRVRHRGLWACVYGCALAAFTTFVLLDTFVIGQSQAKVQAADTSSIETAQASATGTQSSSKTATTTDTTYASDDLDITITTTEYADTTVYVADIQATSAEALKTALANDTYGRNVKETTSQMASDHDAILALNGDYYGFRNDGYVIRNGVLYRDTAASDTDALVVYGDGTMTSVNQSEVTAQELLDQGAWQVLSFGPTLVDGGQVVVDQSTETGRSMSSNPRTAIGMISPLHYVVVVSDGRTSENPGLSLYQLAQVLQDAGCTYAYNLDGGGSTTLWFNGKVINNPTDGHSSGEREVSDIVYFS